LADCRARLLLPLALLSVYACAHAPVRMDRVDVEPERLLCRTTTPGQTDPVRWLAPFDSEQRGRLRAWCDAIGPVARFDPPSAPRAYRTSLIVVGWNMDVGSGRLEDLVAAHWRGSPESERPELVLLIQEAYRSGNVPVRCPADARTTRRLGPPRGAESADILDVARRLQLHAVYVPSMRNGTDCADAPQEDRGNAILSTMPLRDVAAIELPLVRQRRTGIAATVSDGTRTLHVASVHFDTIFGHGRQAQALADAVTALGWQESILISGDFNALPIDAGIREMKARFRELDCGSTNTHSMGRLDRMFARGEFPWASCETGRDRFGSDHRPLVVTIDQPGRVPPPP